MRCLVIPPNVNIVKAQINIIACTISIPENRSELLKRRYRVVKNMQEHGFQEL